MTRLTFDTHAALYDAYLDDLAEALPVVGDWWQSLVECDTLDAVERRWPALAASHPRIIAIFRHYYLQCEQLNDRLESPPATKGLFDDELGWGSDDDNDDGSVWIHPSSLLIEDLESESSELFDFMTHLVLCPVGASLAIDLTRQPGSSTSRRAFSGPIRHDVELGINRLLSAPRDLVVDPRWRERDPASVGAEHRGLFAGYLVDLERALEVAEAWWLGIITQREREGRSREGALQAAYDLVFCGAVSHPDVIGVVRAYWLACDALNAELPPTSWVAPERMLLAWLLDGKHESWVRILTGMPYWPLGLDKNGTWV